jgi:oxidase EvaA
MRVQEIPLPLSREWTLAGGALRHRRGAFFQVVGVAVHVGGKRRAGLDQPLIDQAEVGILGFLVRAGGGATEILIQAKPEPGNVGLVQAAPSVQATESNYRRRHGGRATPFLEHFRHPGDRVVHSDGLQSEQGTRFLGKYNRNMVVEIPASDGSGHDPREGRAFRWFPMGELLPLLLEDHQVNTDARSVLACAPWRLFAPAGAPFGRWRGRGGPGEQMLRSYEAPDDRGVMTSVRILERLRRLRRAAGFVTTVVDLTDLSDWEVGETAIRPRSREDFGIRQFAVSSSDREVARWDQPLVTTSGASEAVLLGQEQGGILHFLFDGRPEIGFRERCQYGPTILDGGPTMSDFGERLPRRSGGTLPRRSGGTRPADALREAAARSRALCAIRNSDEGGRFFRCQTRYRVGLLDPGESVEPGGSLTWMTLGQIERLIRRPGVFTNEARTLISMLLAYL